MKSSLKPEDGVDGCEELDDEDEDSKLNTFYGKDEMPFSASREVANA